MLRKVAKKAKAVLGMTGDFRQKWTAYNTMAGNDSQKNRVWDELGEVLQRVIDFVSQGETEDKLEAVIGSGETILPRMTVAVIDGVAYAADGSNEARKASGVSIGPGSRAGTIYWQATGNLACKVKRSTGVSSYGVLYQSATKGWLTNNPEEVGLEYVQPVGTFVQWLVNPLGGNTSEAIAVFNLNTTVDGSDPDYPVTSVNTMTGDVVLGIDDLDDVDDTSKADTYVLAFDQDSGNMVYVPQSSFTDPLTTKGDIMVYSTETTRLPVGTDGYVLSAASSEATGLKWVPSGGGPELESGTAGEDIDEGELVHVDGTGTVYLADATLTFRYATHVAASTASAGNSVSYTDAGNYEVPTDDVDAYLYTNMHYLSDVTPGGASPKPPAIPANGESRKLWQEIGTSIEIRGNTSVGKTALSINIGSPVIL